MAWHSEADSNPAADADQLLDVILEADAFWAATAWQGDEDNLSHSGSLDIIQSLTGFDADAF